MNSYTTFRQCKNLWEIRLGLGQTTFILLYWLAIVHHPAYYTTIQQINMLTWNIQHWLI